jgi:hypothetical protein
MVAEADEGQSLYQVICVRSYAGRHGSCGNLIVTAGQNMVWIIDCWQLTSRSHSSAEWQRWRAVNFG